MENFIFPAIMAIVVIGLPIAILYTRDKLRRAKAMPSVRDNASGTGFEEDLNWEFLFRFRPAPNDFREWVRCYQWNQFGHPFVRVLCVIVAIAVLAMCIRELLPSENSESSRSIFGQLGIWAVAITSLVAVWVIFIRPIYWGKIANRRMDNNSFSSFRVTRQGFWADDGAEIVKWSELRRLQESPNGLLFESISHKRFFLPNSAFDSASQRKDFIDKLIEVLSQGRCRIQLAH